MAERNSTTVEVDLVLGDSEKLHVGERDDGEGLVDLEGVDLGLLDTGVGESLGDRERGGGGELGWVLSGVTPAEDLADWLEAQLLQLSLGDEDDGGGAIGERRGVGGGDGAVLWLEDWAEGLGLGLVELEGLSVTHPLCVAKSKEMYSRSLARHLCQRQCLAFPFHR